MENNDKNKNDNNPDTPMDDYGIDHDRILEICEFMLNEIHTKYVLEKKEIPTVKDIYMMSCSVDKIWNITKSILDIEEILRTTSEIMEEELENGLSDKQSDWEIDEDEENIDIFVGDIFDLTKELLGKVAAVYDRAALVALPKDLRVKYTKHLMQITDSAPQLLVVYEYNQNEMPGPPFSIKEDEVRLHYANTYNLKRIESIEVPGGMKGQIPAKENVWLLINK
jgi:hypothetical protein